MASKVAALSSVGEYSIEPLRNVQTYHAECCYTDSPGENASELRPMARLPHTYNDACNCDIRGIECGRHRPFSCRQHHIGSSILGIGGESCLQSLKWLEFASITLVCADEGYHTKDLFRPSSKNLLAKLGIQPCFATLGMSRVSLLNQLAAVFHCPLRKPLSLCSLKGDCGPLSCSSIFHLTKSPLQVRSLREYWHPQNLPAFLAHDHHGLLWRLRLGFD